MASQVSEEFHTLYVNNLNEKVPKQELRAALHAVFSPFGKVLDIVTANTYRLRGQAWIVYDTSMDANNAMQSLQSFPFYDKPMKIVVANTTSDAIRRRRGEHIERDGAVRLSRKVENQERERLRRKNATAENATRHEPKAMDGMKRPPSTRIAVQGLPGATTTHMLALLFQQFSGYKDATMTRESGDGEVEFDTTANAVAALNGLQGFRLNANHSLTLSFA